jgi:hypothetical protein
MKLFFSQGYTEIIVNKLTMIGINGKGFLNSLRQPTF